MNDPRAASRKCWLLTADGRNAHLLQASLAERGHVVVEQVAAIEEDWHESEHERPSRRTGKGHHAYASKGHEDEERAHRFAKIVAAWLEHELDQRGIEQVNAFTAPRLLGQLRSVLPARLHGHVAEHAVNLAHLTPRELAVHDAVHAVISASFDEQEDRRPGRMGEPSSLGNRDAAVQIALEHAAVRNTIRDIDDEIDRLAGEPNQKRELGKLGEMLPRFARHLEQHFKLEEQDGFLGHLPVDSGERHLIATLIAEHREFEHGLGALLDDLQRAEQGSGHVSEEFIQTLRELLETLAKHERIETDLVKRLAARDQVVSD